MSALMIVMISSLILLEIRKTETDIVIIEDVSYISLAEDAEFDEALNENNSSVEGLY